MPYRISKVLTWKREITDPDDISIAGITSDEVDSGSSVLIYTNNKELFYLHKAPSSLTEASTWRKISYTKRGFRAWMFNKLCKLLLSAIV